MPRPKTLKGDRVGVFLSFTEGDKALLETVSERSGYNATALIRRFLYLYGSGNKIVGLPQIKPVAGVDAPGE